MSFDGSTIVKINNPKLKALLEEAEKKGLCIKRREPDGHNFYAMSREGMLFLNRFNMELL